MLPICSEHQYVNKKPNIIKRAPELCQKYKRIIEERTRWLQINSLIVKTLLCTENLLLPDASQFAVHRLSFPSRDSPQGKEYAVYGHCTGHSTITSIYVAFVSDLVAAICFKLRGTTWQLNSVILNLYLRQIRTIRLSVSLLTTIAVTSIRQTEPRINTSTVITVNGNNS